MHLLLLYQYFLSYAPTVATPDPAAAAAEAFFQVARQTFQSK